MPSVTRPHRPGARAHRARRHPITSTAAPMTTEEFLVYLRHHPATSSLGRNLTTALETIGER